MILAVCDVQRAPVFGEGHALWPAEHRRFKVTVLGTLGARTNRSDQLAVKIRYKNSVVASIGDEQPSSMLIGQHLARKGQDCRRRACLFEHHLKRGWVDQTGSRVFRRHSCDDRTEHVVGALA